MRKFYTLLTVLLCNSLNYTSNDSSHTNKNNTYSATNTPSVTCNNQPQQKNSTRRSCFQNMYTAHMIHHLKTTSNNQAVHNNQPPQYSQYDNQRMHHKNTRAELSSTNTMAYPQHSSNTNHKRSINNDDDDDYQEIQQICQPHLNESSNNKPDRQVSRSDQGNNKPTKYENTHALQEKCKNPCLNKKSTGTKNQPNQTNTARATAQQVINATRTKKLDRTSWHVSSKKVSSNTPPNAAIVRELDIPTSSNPNLPNKVTSTDNTNPPKLTLSDIISFAYQKAMTLGLNKAENLNIEDFKAEIKSMYPSFNQKDIDEYLDKTGCESLDKIITLGFSIGKNYHQKK